MRDVFFYLIRILCLILLSVMIQNISGSEVFMKENIMDRIGREMAEFLQGMREERTAIAELRKAIDEDRKKNEASFVQERIVNAELRESQKKTDEQIRELRESQKKTDEQIRELRESQKKTDEQIRELRESQKKTDEQIRKTSKKVDDTSDTLGKLGVIDGKVAEDLFYRNVQHVFEGKIPAFSDVRRNVKKKGIPGEYDIVAVGERMVLVVEVKKKMEQDMVDRFVDDQLPKFRLIFPEYRDFPVIGGVGALVMQDAISRYAEKKGLYVLTQNGEGGAMLVNRKNFRAKEF